MCCFKPVFKKKINFIKSNLDLSRYGPGLPIYFKFIFHNIIMCIFVFLINSIYTGITEHRLCQTYKNQCSIYIFNLKVLRPDYESD